MPLMPDIYTPFAAADACCRLPLMFIIIYA